MRERTLLRTHTNSRALSTRLICRQPARARLQACCKRSRASCFPSCARLRSLVLWLQPSRRRLLLARPLVDAAMGIDHGGRDGDERPRPRHLSEKMVWVAVMTDESTTATGYTRCECIEAQVGRKTGHSHLQRVVIVYCPVRSRSPDVVDEEWMLSAVARTSDHVTDAAAILVERGRVKAYT